MAVEITNRTITRKELRRHGLKDNYFIEKWYGNTGWEFIPGERDNMIMILTKKSVDLLVKKQNTY